MNNFDFESKKYTLLIIIICVIFVALIIKAFDYLPEQIDSDNMNIPNINRTVSVEPASNQEQQEQEQNTEEQKPEETPESAQNQGLNVDLQKDVSEELKPIEEENAAIGNKAPVVPERQLSPDEELELKFLSAQKYKNNKQYTKALEEYQAIETQVASLNDKARCYEEIAEIYGIMKHYGTALSYAQKAYNTAPSSQREMLLARLYYKTGDLDKATKRMNNVLQREFANDR